MPKLSKAQRRERKQFKAQHGMRVSGKGLVHIQNAMRKRAAHAHRVSDNPA